MLFFYYLCLKITTWAFSYASVDIYNVDIYIIMRNYIRLILANIAVLLLGTFLIMTGEFTAGMLLAFQGLLSSFMGPVQSLIGFFT